MGSVFFIEGPRFLGAIQESLKAKKALPVSEALLDFYEFFKGKYTEKDESEGDFREKCEAMIAQTGFKLTGVIVTGPERPPYYLLSDLNHADKSKQKFCVLYREKGKLNLLKLKDKESVFVATRQLAEILQVLLGNGGQDG